MEHNDFCGNNDRPGFLRDLQDDLDDLDRLWDLIFREWDNDFQ
jgi:hypothetical protein